MHGETVKYFLRIQDRILWKCHSPAWIGRFLPTVQNNLSVPSKMGTACIKT